MKHRLVVFLLLATPLFIAAAAWMRDRPNAGPPSLNEPTYTAPRSQRKEPLAWGVYQIYWGSRFERNLTKELEQFASPPQYVMGLTVPCLYVCEQSQPRLLTDAMKLDVFSVIETDQGQDLLPEMIARIAQRVYQMELPDVGNRN